MCGRYPGIFQANVKDKRNKWRGKKLHPMVRSQIVLIGCGGVLVRVIYPCGLVDYCSQFGAHVQPVQVVIYVTTDVHATKRRA